jgi:hypothetical protein
MDTVTIEGLTKSDINALRLADDVYAVFYEDAYLLRCIKRPTFAERERNPFADDVRIEVPVTGSITVYGADGGSNFAATESVTACFASLWDSTGIWQVVKPGDRVKLRFAANNSTDNIRAANYVRDSVSVEVIRKADVNGRKPLKFAGGDYVGPNNSARFVRSHTHGL